MEKQVERLKESQTQLTAGSLWRLTLQGEPLIADRLLEMEHLPSAPRRVYHRSFPCRWRG
jgi:hypothetical protein